MMENINRGQSGVATEQWPDVLERMSTPAAGRGVVVGARSQHDGHPSAERHDGGEDQRLGNWRHWLQRWRAQHELLGPALDRNSPDLVVNTAHDYRLVHQEKEVLEAAARFSPPDPARGDPLFWRPPRQLPARANPQLPPVNRHPSRDRAGSGGVPELEHVGMPRKIQQELGIAGKRGRRTAMQTWQRSEYRKKREVDLGDSIAIVRPHRPRTEELVVWGQSAEEITRRQDMYRAMPVISVSCHTEHEHTDREWQESEPEVLPKVLQQDATASFRVAEHVLHRTSTCLHSLHPEEMTSPSMGDQDLVSSSSSGPPPPLSVRHSNEHSDKEYSLVFFGEVGEKCSESLQVENLGNVAVTYFWHPLSAKPQDVPAPEVENPIPRFFFNKNDGLVAPGQVLDMRFLFRSPSPGVFRETWELGTCPQFAGRLLVRLWGAAIEPDHGPAHLKLQELLKKRAGEAMAQRVTRELVLRSRPKPPPGPPLAARYLEDELFVYVNPGLFYHPDAVAELRQLHRRLTVNDVWDLRVDRLRQRILQDAPDKERRRQMMDVLERAVATLAAPRHESSVGCRRLRAVRGLLCGLANAIEAAAAGLRRRLGLLATPPPPRASGRDDTPPPPTRQQQRRRESRTSRTGATVTVPRSANIGRPARVSSQLSLTSDSWTDPAMRAQYLEALFIEVYHLVGRTLGQISAALDSYDQL